MRVTWLCPHPLGELGFHPLRPGIQEHASSWVVALREQLERRDDTHLTLVVPTRLFAPGIERRSEGAEVRAVALPHTALNLAGGLVPMGRRIREAVRATDPELVVVWGTEHLWSMALLGFERPVLFRFQGVASSLGGVNRRLVGVRSLPTLGTLSALREQLIFARGRFFAVQSAWDLQWVRRVNQRAHCFEDTCLVRAPFWQAPPPRNWSKPEVLAVGLTSLQKGFPVLLDVTEKLRAHHPDIRVHLVGNLSNTLRARFGERLRQLEGTLQLHGYLQPEPLIALMARCCCYLSTSWMESFGMAAVEAQMQGLPVVASLAGALPTWIEEGHNGLLCEPGNGEDYARAVSSLLADPQRAERLGAAGSELVRRRHDTERAAAAHRAIYDRMLEVL